MMTSRLANGTHNQPRQHRRRARAHNPFSVYYANVYGSKVRQHETITTHVELATIPLPLKIAYYGRGGGKSSSLGLIGRVRHRR